MKNRNRTITKVIAGLLITVICALVAFGMCKSYGIIRKTAVDKQYNYFETSGFQTNLLEYCYGIAYDMMVEPDDKDWRKPAELFYKDVNDVSPYEIGEFSERVSYWNRKLTIENENLKYYATRGEKKLGNDVSLPSEGDESRYQFYVKMQFDKDGLITVSNLQGAERMYFNQSGYLNWMKAQEEYEFKPIKDMSVVFAIPTVLTGGDSIAEGVRNQSAFQYTKSAIIVAAMWLLLLFVIALLFPYAWAKDFAVLKVPFDFWFIAGIVVFIAVNMIGRFGVGQSIVHDSILIGEFLVTHQMIMVGNFMVWFGIFLVTFLGILELKSIFILGFKDFVKKRTLLGRFLCYGVRVVSQTVEYVTHIDLRENNNKYIMKLLGINAIIMLLITSVWVAGIPMVIVYSVVLYVIIKKYVGIISENYRMLTETTNRMAEGDIDVTMKEDLGVFNPFKDNLEKIQSGFKKAVQEEVKSQKMKTDLISNVSHDLKTPLTAIVTYTDLLKDPKLPEEKREEYLEVLDRKAQRLQVLIEDLFEMSKVSSGTVQLNLEQVDVVSLLKQTLVEVEDQLADASLTVKTTFSSERIMLKLDSERMYRVFENLLLNASKYAMKNTRVYLDIIEEADHVVITVKNISAEEITFNENEIVERFIRGDKSRNTEGSGLGLAIAKSFVELQGGKFHIQIDGDLFKAVIRLSI